MFMLHKGRIFQKCRLHNSTFEFDNHFFLQSSWNCAHGIAKGREGLWTECGIMLHISTGPEKMMLGPYQLRIKHLLVWGGDLTAAFLFQSWANSNNPAQWPTENIWLVPAACNRMCWANGPLVWSWRVFLRLCKLQEPSPTSNCVSIILLPPHY